MATVMVIFYRLYPLITGSALPIYIYNLSQNIRNVHGKYDEEALDLGRA
jgi:hypothetical protein